jgi:hypothetical protein
MILPLWVKFRDQLNVVGSRTRIDDRAPWA